MLVRTRILAFSVTSILTLNHNSRRVPSRALTSFLLCKCLSLQRCGRRQTSQCYLCQPRPYSLPISFRSIYFLSISLSPSRLSPSAITPFEAAALFSGVHLDPIPKSKPKYASREIYFCRTMSRSRIRLLVGTRFDLITTLRLWSYVVSLH